MIIPLEVLSTEDEPKAITGPQTHYHLGGGGCRVNVTIYWKRDSGEQFTLSVAGGPYVYIVKDADRYPELDLESVARILGFSLPKLITGKVT